MIKLEQVQTPDLIDFDRESLETEIISRIKRHPSWSDNYNGLLLQDSMLMVISIYTYLFGKNAESFDRKLRDVFFQTSYSDEARAYAIERANITLAQNTEASVNIKCTLIDDYRTDVFYIPNSTTVYGTGLDNSAIPFEIIEKNDDGYDYINDIKITPGSNFTSFSITGYAGLTKSHTYDVTANEENFDIEVPYYNVIEDSIKVYYYKNGFYYLMEENKDDSYGQIISNDMFPDGMPKYILKYAYNGQPIVTFGTDAFCGKFTIDHEEGQIVVFGRYGGGENSNIYTGSINETIDVELNVETTISINFTNTEEASGGVDAEELDDVIDYVLTRAGRGKQIVDTIDTKNAILNLLTKHVIEVPDYDEEKNTNSVPLLHNYHYIVPKRDFTTMEFPTANYTYSISEYCNLINAKITDFCNVKGNHDSAVVGEDVAKEFYKDGSDYSFDVTLAQNPISSNSVELEAYNSNDKMIDKITFEGNYPLTDTITNLVLNGKVVVTSDSVESLIIYVSSDTEQKANNAVQFSIDDYDFDFSLSLPTGAYSMSELTNELNNKIVDEVTNNFESTDELYQLIVTNGTTIFSYADSKLSLTSLNVNTRSMIELIGEDNSASKQFFNDLGLDVGLYLPDRTKRVFSDNCFFYYSESKVYVEPNTDSLSVTLEYDVDIEQSSTTEDSPTYSLILTDEVFDELYGIQNDTALVFSFYNDDEIIDQVEIKSYSSTASELVSYSNGGHPTADGEGCLYDENSVTLKPLTNKVNFTFKKGTLSSAYVSDFVEDYGEIKQMKISKVTSSYDEETEETTETYTLIKLFDYADDWVQATNDIDGNKIVLYLDDAEALGSYVYALEILCGDVDLTKRGEIRFDVGSNNITIGDLTKLDSTTELFDEDTEQIYNAYYNRIELKLVDAIIDTEADDVYTKSFEDFNKIKITFQNETYSYIVANYQGNPYSVEGEALTYSNILNKKSKRLIGLENIIKDINFVPISFAINLYIRETYSASKAMTAVYELLVDSFSLNNYNYFYDIEDQPDDYHINSLIMANLTEYGIIKAEISGDIKTYVTGLDDSRKNYFFLLEDDMIADIKSIGTEYTNLLGIEDEYKLTINPIMVEV